MVDLQQCYTEIETELSGKFLNKKMDNIPLIESYERLGMYDKAQKVYWCGSQLDFRIPEDSSEAPKLYRANFCKDRLCSCCTWRRTMKVFGQVSQVMDVIQDKYAFIFLTLTIRNTSAEKLSKAIDELQAGFRNLIRSPTMKKAIKGTFKALEITYHPENLRDVEYHPHLHVICAVNKSYFKSRDYISHEKLVELFQKACKLDYKPSVRIEKVKPEKTQKKGEINLKKAVCEVTKYTVKTSEITTGCFDEIDRAVKTYSRALASRRVCAFSGIFKEVARELELDDLNDGDLVNTDNEKVRTDIGYLIVSYKWQVGYGYRRTFVEKERLDKNERGTTGNGISKKLRRNKVATGYRARVQDQLAKTRHSADEQH